MEKHLLTLTVDIAESRACCDVIDRRPLLEDLERDFFGSPS